jgi:hypothetical protein
MRHAVTVARQARRNSLALPDRRVDPARENVYAGEEKIQLRQIDDFSPTHEKKKIKCIFLAFSLIFHSAICMVIFFLNVNVVTIFSAGACILLAQLLQCGFEFFEEGARTQRAYRTYLGKFSYHVLAHLRKTAKLSAWSKYEIDQYLAAIS